MIEKYTKITSLISIMFFIGAVLFEVFYYRKFGIDIFTFISFSEIISIFIGNIPHLLFFAIFVFGFIYVAKWLFRGLIDKLSNITKYNPTERRRINQKGFNITRMLFGIWIFFVMIFPNFFKRYFIHSEIWFYIKSFATLILIFNFTFPLFLSKQFNDDTKKLFLVVYVIAFYVTIYLFSNKLVWNVINQPSSNPSLQVFLKDGRIITTSPEIVYLGKTNNYLFLYKKTVQLDSSFTTIIKMDNIDSLKYFKSIPEYTPF